MWLGKNDHHTYDVEFPEPCGLTIELQAGDGWEVWNPDFDLYVTLDGRQPSITDYDRVSFSDGISERIEIGRSDVANTDEIGVMVRRYRGSGDYELSFSETAADVRSNHVHSMKDRIVEYALEMWRNDRKLDCADVYLTAASRAADDLGLPLAWRGYDASAGRYVRYRRSDYDSVDEFAEYVRMMMGAIHLIDNTQPRDWDDLEAGDVFLYDLREEGDGEYTGHTQVIVGRDGNEFDIVQGTLPPEISRETYTKSGILNKLGGPEEDKGRQLNWDLVLG